MPAFLCAFRWVAHTIFSVDRFVLRNNVGSKHIDKRQTYFFQNQVCRNE